MASDNMKMPACHFRCMSEDCMFPETHVYCPGCSCLCHWDEKCVDHFIARGRKQSLALLMTMVHVNFASDNLNKTIRKLDQCHLLKP